MPLTKHDISSAVKELNQEDPKGGFALNQLSPNLQASRAQKRICCTNVQRLGQEQNCGVAD